ncbi:flavodoxin [Anaerocolumna xylanovorans]|uniref:Flavodoxin n=1 Tax=Anaerocolumna xylanovorans DSM 12503 TaxID=1121345 RepID=A0A1M7Y174_9FIRM|nr:flavodoxin [Anaerocolumna xylanovorans]SHO45442.1 Flavodoxin [Anaerocolumna xylanovorans DSM 12503]
MRKLSFIAIFMSIVLLEGCGRTDTLGTTDSAKNNPTAVGASEQVPTSADGNILIAYFSRVGNTDFPDNVDAESSASIQLDGDEILGNCEVIANDVQKVIGGDVFLIQTADKYPADYKKTVKQNVEEQEKGYLPEIAGKVKNMKHYDRIILIYPTWAMSLPQAVASFLDNYDLTGKDIYPINVNGGYGAGDTVSLIREHAKGAKVDDGIAINAQEPTSAEDKIKEYLLE